MKATMVIPDELYRSVKAKSALLGLTVREVTIDLFQKWVVEDEIREAGEPPATDWVADWLRHRIPAGQPGPTAREILERGRDRLEPKGSRGVERKDVAAGAKRSLGSRGRGVPGVLTVDANVWVAALDEDDAMHAPSVLFLEAGALELGARLRLRGAVSTRPAPRRRELPRRGFAD